MTGRSRKLTFFLLSLLAATNAGAEGTATTVTRPTGRYTTYYLNVTLTSSYSDAILSIDNYCRGKRHQFGKADVAQSIQQDLTPTLPFRSLSDYCIAIGDSLTSTHIPKIRVIPQTGGSCKHSTGQGQSSEQTLGGMALNQFKKQSISVKGCYADISGMRFGGITLKISDGMWIAKDFVQGHYAGIMTSFGNYPVWPINTAAEQAARLEKYRYLIEIDSKVNGKDYKGKL